VAEAAAILGVNVVTIRRMIKRGQLEAERVHRPQGSAYLVTLPQQGAVDDTPKGQPEQDMFRTQGTPTPVAEVIASMIQAALTPIIAPLVAELAAVRQAGERKDDAIRAQADQLVAQAETIGELRARVTMLDAEKATLTTPTATQASEPSPELLPLWRHSWAVYGVGIIGVIGLVAGR